MVEGAMAGVVKGTCKGTGGRGQPGANKHAVPPKDMWWCSVLHGHAGLLRYSGTVRGCAYGA
jgi:hypothetical protein